MTMSPGEENRRAGPQQTAGQVAASRPLRILAVDDDDLNRDIMRIMLTPLGTELEFACDGAEALEAIQSRSFDLVFMDLILPDQSGREVTRRVREWEAGRSHLPIVAVTALDMPGQPMELFKAGMDDYIFKPYDARGLQRIIELYARGDRGSSSGATEQSAVDEAAEAPVLDWRGSLADFSNDAAGYRELLKDFVDRLPERLERMRQAQRDGDLERLNRECHSLKGVSAGLGALRLSRLATRAGRACGQGGEPVGPVLERLDAAVGDLQREAKAYLES